MLPELKITPESIPNSGAEVEKRPPARSTPVYVMFDTMGALGPDPTSAATRSAGVSPVVRSAVFGAFGLMWDGAPRGIQLLSDPCRSRRCAALAARGEQTPRARMASAASATERYFVVETVIANSP